MNAQVLISIRPEHAVNILNGKKTIELRKVVLKWVLEEVAKGNTVIFNIYVTKGKKYILHKYKDKYYTQHYLTFTDDVEALNGKVVASFEVSKIENIKLELIDKSGYDEDKQVWFETPNLRGNELEVMSYVSQDEMEKYFTNEVGYALYISNLKVFDEPKELSDFYVINKGLTYDNATFRVHKALHMMTVFVNAHDDNKWYFDTIKL